MAVLNELEPKEVFRFFEEISAIPRGSRDTKRISDYLVAFAKERDLKVIQDEVNNVIIFQPGTPGYEESEPVILQGHMRMHRRLSSMGIWIWYVKRHRNPHMILKMTDWNCMWKMDF